MSNQSKSFIQQLREMVEDQQKNYEKLVERIDSIEKDQEKIKSLIDFEYELFKDGSDKKPKAIQRRIEKVEESMVNILKSFKPIKENSITFQRRLRKEWSRNYGEFDIATILNCFDCSKEDCPFSQLIICAYKHIQSIREFIQKHIDICISETSKDNKNNLNILNQIKKDVE